jgi:hypothetical protein
MRKWSLTIDSCRSVSCFVQSAGSAGAGGAFSSVLLCGTGSQVGLEYCDGAVSVCATVLNAIVLRNSSIAISFTWSLPLGFVS